MRIIDLGVRASFRRARRCERCQACTKTGADPHHHYPKGMGGGSTLDIRVNLVSLCRDCHNRVENGNIPRSEILAIIAARECTTPEDVMAEIHRLLRTPKPME